jgi:hypothetical protein
MSNYERFAALDGLTPEEVREFLEDHAARVDETEYMMPLSEEELENIKLRVYEATEQKLDLEEQYKGVREEFNEKTKALKEFIEDRVSEVRMKARREFGRLYRIVDTANKKAYDVNSDGVIISSGELKDSDKQLVINQGEMEA